MALDELLPTPSCAIDAGHHAEESSAVASLRYFGCHRGPNSIRAGIEAGVPDCLDLTGRGSFEKNDLILGDRVLRVGTSGRVLGGKDRGPTVTNGCPSRWRQAAKRLVWDNLALRADDQVAMRALQAILRCTNR